MVKFFSTHTDVMITNFKIQVILISIPRINQVSMVLFKKII